MGAHYKISYFNPHPTSRLAYYAEAVRIWCDWLEAQPSLLESEQGVGAALSTTTASTIERFGSDNPAVPYIVKAEFDALEGYCTNKSLAIAMEDLLRGKPGKNNRRADTPKHIPLRPHARIVVLMMDGLATLHPEKSKNAIHNLCAQLSNEEIPNAEAGAKLSPRNIRSAEVAYFGMGKNPWAEMARAGQRLKKYGAPHVWDRNIFEKSLWAEVESKGDPALIQPLYKSDAFLTFEPFRAIDRIYRSARSEPRFKKTSGVELARAIDAVCGLGWLVERCLDHPTLAAAQEEIRTVFANVAA